MAHTTSVSVSGSEQIPIDRTSLSQDPNTHESQLYAQLAHSIVKFLGLNSPQELAEFGLNVVSDLVDLISRVASSLSDHYPCAYGYFPSLRPIHSLSLHPPWRLWVPVYHLSLRNLR